jgi:hypothetical protein
MRCGEAGACGARADCLSDAEFLPQRPRCQHNAELEDALDLNFRNVLAGADEAIAGIEHAVDAFDQSLQGGTIHLIGAAELCTTRASGRFASGFQTLSARA